MNAEVHLNEPFGQDIFQTVIKYDLRKNLEIGSWDGEGSTTCYVEAMKHLAGDKELVCIEIIDEKFEILKNRFKHIPWITYFKGSSIAYNDLLYTDFEDIWNSAYNNIPKYKYSKELVKSWFDRDVETIKNSVSYLNKDAPFFDSVLIDGGEFTGYSEYKLLKNKTKVFFLDDVHQAFKCFQIYDELIHNSEWNLLSENSFCRNGYAIFKKKDL